MQAQYRGKSPELLSLRGIAATAVLMAHASNTFLVGGLTVGDLKPALYHGGPSDVMANLWLQVILAPSAAVTFFYVHSGFVLALSLSLVDWTRGRTLREGAAFYLRRVLRIWPMVIVCCAMAFVYAWAFPPSQSTILTPWFRNFFNDPLSLKYLWDNLSLQSYSLEPFLWSVGVEGYGSLLIPIFFLFARRKSGYVFLFCGIAIILLFVPEFIRHGLFGPIHGLGAFLFSFALGTMLPFLEDRTKAAWWNSTPAILAASLVLILARHYSDLTQAVVVESIASALIIYSVYYRSDGVLQWFCRLRPVAFMGEISYSVYVNALLCTHLVVVAVIALLGATFISHHAFEMNVIVAILSVPVTAALSAATYYFVEWPGIKIGRKLGDLIKGKKAELPSMPAAAA
jgi:peptidoglycan/LPS O-acetylase OafA/YrhL